MNVMSDFKSSTPPLLNFAHRKRAANFLQEAQFAIFYHKSN